MGVSLWAHSKGHAKPPEPPRRRAPTWEERAKARARRFGDRHRVFSRQRRACRAGKERHDPEGRASLSTASEQSGQGRLGPPKRTARNAPRLSSDCPYTQALSSSLCAENRSHWIPLSFFMHSPTPWPLPTRTAPKDRTGGLEALAAREKGLETVPPEEGVVWPTLSPKNAGRERKKAREGTSRRAVVGLHLRSHESNPRIGRRRFRGNLG